MGGMLLLVVFFVIVSAAIKTMVALGVCGFFWVHDVERWLDSVTNQWRLTKAMASIRERHCMLMVRLGKILYVLLGLAVVVFAVCLYSVDDAFFKDNSTKNCIIVCSVSVGMTSCLFLAILAEWLVDSVKLMKKD